MLGSSLRGSALALLTVCLILTGCDGDGSDDTGSPTAEPTPTTAATPTTPSPTSTGEPATRLGLDLVADGLTAPTDLASPDDGSGRMFVTEQTGAVRVIDATGALLDEPFLDVSERMVTLMENYDERGLLGIAFHPDYSENGRLFVYYSAPLRDEAPDGWNNTTVLAEYQVSDDENVADPESHRIVIEIDQPQFNHQGGHLAFGPDGYLYLPLGDGGAGNDVGEGHTPNIGNAQDRSNLLGSILRLDIDAEGTGLTADTESRTTIRSRTRMMESTQRSGPMA